MLLSGQIRQGRYETFDQSLVREYRMSLQGISKQISGDFCEVYNSLILHLINENVYEFFHYIVSVIPCQGVRARMVDKDLAPKVGIV